MKILLIRPEDELLCGPWTFLSWDRVIDLGRTGNDDYSKARSYFGCPISIISDFRDGFNDVRRVRDLLTIGFGKLRDPYGLDWWELTSILSHSHLESVLILQKMLSTIGSNDEVYVSGPGFHADVVRLALGGRAKTFGSEAGRRRLRHYLRTVRKFPVRQLMEIFWDKADPGYQIRGIFSLRRKPQHYPLVLLPTAYINVSRTGIGYASTVPDTHFLLVATRPSGWIENRPPNVTAASLRSYASLSSHSRRTECEDLGARWERLRKELEEVTELRILLSLGLLDDLSGRLARGLEVRDAWRNVLDCEPIRAVICADDSNPYTHIPLLLAKERGLATVSCHHGALDGRYMFKRYHANFILAKGKMEADYLVQACGVPAERVLIGAPSVIHQQIPFSESGEKRLIVLFSEPYEVMGGRATGVYGDLLPRLYKLAVEESCQLVVKLHPFESLVERRQMIDRILGPEKRRSILITKDPLRSEMLDKTWFGITILSTVAIECAMREIPCFLCRWLDSSAYGYIDQFTRFEAGIRLNHPDEILSIPTELRATEPKFRLRDDYWHPIDDGRLLELLRIRRYEDTEPQTGIALPQ